MADGGWRMKGHWQSLAAKRTGMTSTRNSPSTHTGSVFFPASHPDSTLGAVFGDLDLACVFPIHFFAVKL
jgi:hypothetical protein